MHDLNNVLHLIGTGVYHASTQMGDQERFKSHDFSGKSWKALVRPSYQSASWKVIHFMLLGLSECVSASLSGRV